MHVTAESEGDLLSWVICQYCDYQPLHDGPASWEFEPACLGRAVPCARCGRWVRFQMKRPNIPSFQRWTQRLVEVHSQVPEEFWVTALAALDAAEEDGAYSVQTELFVNAVLDLDLLQQ